MPETWGIGGTIERPSKTTVAVVINNASASNIAIQSSSCSTEAVHSIFFFLKQLQHWKALNLKQTGHGKTTQIFHRNTSSPGSSNPKIYPLNQATNWQKGVSCLSLEEHTKCMSDKWRTLFWKMLEIYLRKPPAHIIRNATPQLFDDLVKASSHKNTNCPLGHVGIVPRVSSAIL